MSKLSKILLVGILILSSLLAAPQTQAAGCILYSNLTANSTFTVLVTLNGNESDSAGVLVGVWDEDLGIYKASQSQRVSSCNGNSCTMNLSIGRLDPTHSYSLVSEVDPTPQNDNNGDSQSICQQGLTLDDTDEAAPRPAESALTQETLNSLNPLVQHSTGVEEDLSNPGGVISRVLRFAFPIAGLLLFVMLVWSGFEMLSGAASKKSIDAGKQRATAAVIGFVLLFMSYFFAQLIEVIFGITIF